MGIEDLLVSSDRELRVSPGVGAGLHKVVSKQFVFIQYKTVSYTLCHVDTFDMLFCLNVMS